MSIPEVIIRVCLGILLTAGAVQDIQVKRIYTWFIAAAALPVAACIPFCTGISWAERTAGALVGVGVIILSKATGGKIGLGDGLVLCVTGMALGFWCNMELFTLSLLAAALVSIVLLILRRADRKKRIPFIPFLLFGHILQTFLS